MVRSTLFEINDSIRPHPKKNVTRNNSKERPKKGKLMNKQLKLGQEKKGSVKNSNLASINTITPNLKVEIIIT